MPISLQEIKDCPAFSNLGEPTLRRLSEVCYPVRAPESTFVQFEGDDLGAVYFILSGCVQVVRTSPGGRQQVLATLERGASFNNVSPLLGKSRCPASVKALGEAHLAALPVDAYLALVQGQIDFSNAMLGELARRLNHMTGLVEDLSLRSVKARLARFLLKQADSPGSHSGWTQDEIAAQLGSVRDVIGRALRSLEESGLLRRERENILLLDREGLEEEAQNG